MTIKRIDNVLQGTGVERDEARLQAAVDDLLQYVQTRAFALHVVEGIPLEHVFKRLWADLGGSVHRCTVCGAEDIGDRPDCPEDGVNCNIVERD